MPAGRSAQPTSSRPPIAVTATACAKGLDPLGMFAELMATDGGTNSGRGGSMHIADPKLGIFGANGIVGAGLPIAVGAAAASQLRARRQSWLSRSSATARSPAAPSTKRSTLRAVWQLPVVFFCENNGYAEFSPAATQHAAPLEKRAAGYGINSRRRSTGTMWWRRRP